MANNIGRIGPTAAWQLLLLWLEGKQQATVSEVELWESIVIESLNRIEAKANRLWGNEGEPDDLLDPSDG